MIYTHSAGGIVLNPFGEVACVSQRGGVWSLPKGHIEENEDALLAAHREIKEETGISQLQLMQSCPVYERYKIGLNGKDDTSEKKCLHFFIFNTHTNTLQSEDKENPEAKWISPNDILSQLTHKADCLFFERQMGIINNYTNMLINIKTTTTSLAEAEHISKQIIKQKLAACCQIDGPVTSYYEWENKLEKSLEYRLSIKTTRRHAKELFSLLNQLHSYDCPEIVFTELFSYQTDYNNWIQNQIKP
ncbi:hypothetical protein DID76_00650 [Candidatus Marinamargulisbacteria bacterium SCGC AG-414-C22]|nr:hypothetical protein DID76_00650 [Candidatus Marinamargulisbacteria bacterium SCGC AG-414-C22]